MKNSVYVFGSLNGNGLTGLNGARGTYVNPSNFAARDAAVFDNGANIPVSLRTDGQSPLSTVGFANQQLVTASSVGANTPAFLTSISFDSRSALRVRIHSVGFLERVQRRNQQQRSTGVRGSGRSVAMGCRRSRRQPRKSPGDRHGHLHRPRHRQHRQRDRGSTAISPPARFRTWSTSEPAWAPSGSTGWTEPTMAARSELGTAERPVTSTYRRRAASATAGIKGAHSDPGRLILPGRPQQFDPTLWRDGWLPHLNRTRRLSRQRDFRGA